MLTQAQNITLKNYINADPILSTYPMNSDGDFDIARLLQLDASPGFIVWRTDVPVIEIMKNGMDWTRVDNLSIGKARIWDWMSQLGTLDASKPNIRGGIDATWGGTAADLSVRATVYSHCKRKASVIEKLFSTGTGSDASPATMGYEGGIYYQDVGIARNS